MRIQDIKKSFSQVRTLCEQADLITVATSPFFLDQEIALELVMELFLGDG
jgi:hypothetical protein